MFEREYLEVQYQNRITIKTQFISWHNKTNHLKYQTSDATLAQMKGNSIAMVLNIILSVIWRHLRIARDAIDDLLTRWEKFFHSFTFMLFNLFLTHLSVNHHNKAKEQ